jgi:uncharacterized protein YkwD
MNSRLCLTVLVVSGLFLVGGCPQIQSDTTTTDPAGGPTAGGTSGTATGGTTSAAPATDGLSERFPGCLSLSDAEQWAREVLTLVNDWRATSGVGPLTWNETLAAQAEQYACELIYYDFFAHENPVTGTRLADRTSDFGYEYTWIGENLAAGQRTPAEVVEAWMNSPCHRQNIMHPAFTELGVGIRFGGEYGYYWVQEFGRSMDDGLYTGAPYSDPDCEN